MRLALLTHPGGARRRSGAPRAWQHVRRPSTSRLHGRAQGEGQGSIRTGGSMVGSDRLNVPTIDTFTSNVQGVHHKQCVPFVVGVLHCCMYTVMYISACCYPVSNTSSTQSFMGRSDTILSIVEKIDYIVPLAHFPGCKAWRFFVSIRTGEGGVVSDQKFMCQKWPNNGKFRCFPQWSLWSWPHAGQEALYTYTSWYAYAAMFGSSMIQSAPLAICTVLDRSITYVAVFCQPRPLVCNATTGEGQLLPTMTLLKGWHPIGHRSVGGSVPG